MTRRKTTKPLRLGVKLKKCSLFLFVLNHVTLPLPDHLLRIALFSAFTTLQTARAVPSHIKSNLIRSSFGQHPIILQRIGFIALWMVACIEQLIGILMRRRTSLKFLRATMVQSFDKQLRTIYLFCRTYSMTTTPKYNA